MIDELLLDIHRLKITFFTSHGEVKAVNDISFQLKEGEVLGIVGESGCGKSVTAYSIMGLITEPGKIVGGNIRFNGHQIEKMSEKQLQKIRGNEVSIIFQDHETSLNPVLTIGNQIMEALSIHKIVSRRERKAKALELLELVGINEPRKRLNQYPHEYSGGMRQRAMIAMALACEPKLLIADEATSSLDVTIQAQILELLIDLKRKLGMSMIMITHDLGVAATMCDKVAVMYAGKIVEYGTIEDIFNHGRHQYTVGLLKSTPTMNEQDASLIPIEGIPIDLLHIPKGCPFAPRCKKAMKICLKKMPNNTYLTNEHYSACWLLDKEKLEGEQNG